MIRKADSQQAVHLGDPQSAGSCCPWVAHVAACWLDPRRHLKVGPSLMNFMDSLNETWDTAVDAEKTADAYQVLLTAQIVWALET